MAEKRRMSGRTAIVVLFLVVGGLTLAGTGLLPRPEEFRHDVESWGLVGVLGVAGLAIGHAVVSFPSEILNVAAGYAYGFGPALPLMMVSWTASCLLAYWLAFKFGERIANRLVEPRALERLREWAADAPVPVLLAVRAIPVVPINLISYAAGLARMPLWRFTWTTAAGLTPQFALPIYAGSQARDVELTDPTIWGATLAWFALIVIGWLAYRRLAPGGAGAGSAAGKAGVAGQLRDPAGAGSTRHEPDPTHAAAVHEGHGRELATGTARVEPASERPPAGA